MSVCVKQDGQLVKSAGLYSVTKPIGMADIYSTEEKEVGLWVDNKPLYQKTFIITPTSASFTVDISSLNIEKLIDRQATLSRAVSSPSSIQQKDVQYRTETSGYNSYGVVCELINDTIQVGIEGYTVSEITEIRVTLKYTKTTDTPWSGKFVPQGYGYVSSGDIYSFEERQVGVWTDGKPLYQKSIHLNNVVFPNNNRTIVPWTGYISDIDTIAHAEAVTVDELNRNLNAYQISTFSSYGLAFFVDKTDGMIFSRGNGGDYTTDVVVTIKYTKTTDVAGSGEYVPSGDKAEHYSADEHIIGTWTDGSTLYERTVRVPANTTGQNIVTLWNDTNIQVRDYSGCFVFRASENTATLSCRPTDASYKLVVYTIGCSEQYGVYAEIDLGTQRGNAVDLMLTLKYIKVTS